MVICGYIDGYRMVIQGYRYNHLSDSHTRPAEPRLKRMRAVAVAVLPFRTLRYCRHSRMSLVREEGRRGRREEGGGRREEGGGRRREGGGRGRREEGGRRKEREGGGRREEGGRKEREGGGREEGEGEGEGWERTGSTAIIILL